MAGLTELVGLPEIVRDSRLPAEFRWEGQQQFTIHTQGASRRAKKSQEVWAHRGTLGQGGFGSVELQEKQSKSKRAATQLRAVKSIRIPEEELKENHDFYVRELEAIVKFSQARYGELFVKSYGWFACQSVLYIAMEYCELGDLQRYLVKKCDDQRLPESQAHDIASQVLDALARMHEEKFAHRDLKPANILIKSHPPDHPWTVKVADFGISRRDQGTAMNATTTVRGTGSFMPPELLGFGSDNSRAADLFAVDVWCYGETLFRMMTGESTFKKPVDLYGYYFGQVKFPTDVLVEKQLSPDAIGFLQALLACDPKERLTTVMALDHPWMQAVFNGSDASSIRSFRSTFGQVLPTTNTSEGDETARLENTILLVDNTEDAEASAAWPEDLETGDETMNHVSLESSAVKENTEASAVWPDNSESENGHKDDSLSVHPEENSGCNMLPDLTRSTQSSDESVHQTPAKEPGDSNNGSTPSNDHSQSVGHQVQILDTTSTPSMNDLRQFFDDIEKGVLANSKRIEERQTGENSKQYDAFTENDSDSVSLSFNEPLQHQQIVENDFLGPNKVYTAEDLTFWDLPISLKSESRKTQPNKPIDTTPTNANEFEQGEIIHQTGDGLLPGTKMLKSHPDAFQQTNPPPPGGHFAGSSSSSERSPGQAQHFLSRVQQSNTEESLALRQVDADNDFRIKKYDEARAKYETLWNDAKAFFGKTHKRTIHSLSRLLECMMIFEEYWSAETKCRELLDILVSVWSPIDKEALDCRRTMARIFTNTGRLDDAVADYNAMILICKRYNHTAELYEYLEDLTYVYLRQEKTEEAKSAFQEHLKIKGGLLGRTHELVLDSVYGFATSLYMTNKNEAAAHEQVLRFRSLVNLLKESGEILTPKTQSQLEELESLSRRPVAPEVMAKVNADAFDLNSWIPANTNLNPNHSGKKKSRMKLLRNIFN